MKGKIHSNDGGIFPYPHTCSKNSVQHTLVHVQLRIKTVKRSIKIKVKHGIIFLAEAVSKFTSTAGFNFIMRYFSVIRQSARLFEKA